MTGQQNKGIKRYGVRAVAGVWQMHPRADGPWVMYEEVAAALSQSAGAVEPDYKARFETTLSMICEISEALGIPDDEAACANGNDLILAAIARLRASTQRQAAGDGRTDAQIDAILEHAESSLGMGRTGWGYIDARNIARAILAAPRQPGEVGAGILQALVWLHSVATVADDKDYAAITNAAAVIERATCSVAVAEQSDREWRIRVLGPAGARFETFTGETLDDALESVRRQRFLPVSDEDGFVTMEVQVHA